MNELDCKTVILYPPKNFIEYNMIIEGRPRYKDEVPVDACLADEIQELWSKGIHTDGCCCGHGVNDGYISVWGEHIEEMEKMGYKRPNIPLQQGCEKYYFKPKTTNHILAEKGDTE